MTETTRKFINFKMDTNEHFYLLQHLRTGIQNDIHRGFGLHDLEVKLLVRLELANIHGRLDDDCLDMETSRIVERLVDQYEERGRKLPDWLSQALELDFHRLMDKLQGAAA